MSPPLAKGPHHDLTFQGELTVGTDSDELQLRIPAVTGAIVQLDRTVWLDQDGNSTEAQGLRPVDPLQLEAVAGADNTWRVLEGAEAPALRLPRPKEAGFTCQIEGGLR